MQNSAQKPAQNPAQIQPDLAQIDPRLFHALDIRDSLHEFIKYHWDVLEDFEFHDNWHLKVIADATQRCIEGRDFKNLIINMPPRHGKSWTTGIALVPWTWLHSPGTRFMYVTYAIDLSKDHAIHSRNLIRSEKYEQIRYQLSALPGYENWGMDRRSDTNLKFANTKSGQRFSTAVTAKTTGFGGHVIIADDLQNVQEAESETARDRAIKFWDRTLSSRQNNPKQIRKILIMHRLHTCDITAHVLEKAKESGEHWEHLVIPARYEDNHPFPSTPGLNFTDPRSLIKDPAKRNGAVLWKGFYDEKELGILEHNMGKYASAGQLYQKPVPDEGGILNKKDFNALSYEQIKRIFDEGRNVFKLTSYDTASTEKDDKQNAWTARWTFLVYEAENYGIKSVGSNQEKDYRFLLTEYWKGRIETPDLIRDIWTHYEKSQDSGHPIDNVGGVIAIEKHSSGIAAYQALKDACPVMGHLPKGDKRARARAISPFVEAGYVDFPAESPSIRSGIEELGNFPYGTERDTMDAFSQGMFILTHIKGYKPREFTLEFTAAPRKHDSDDA